MCLGVLLLCTVLLTVVLSGHSFAKYVSKKQLSNEAGVASLKCEARYSEITYKDITINVNDPAVYMVVDEFTMENTGEVAYEFDLSLVLSRVTGSESYDAPVAIDLTAVTAPAKGNGVAFRQIRMNAGAAEIADVNFGSVCTGQTYTAGKVYYAVSADGANYTWHTADELAMTGEILPQGKIYYKVAYFIDLSTRHDGFVMPQASLLYRVDCEQILK